MAEALPLMLKESITTKTTRHKPLSNRGDKQYPGFVSKSRSAFSDPELDQGSKDALPHLPLLPKPIQKKVIGLHNTQWAFVLLIGPSGVGKSQLPLLWAFILSHRVKWLQVRHWYAITAGQRCDGGEANWINMIIDDIGYVKKTDSETQVLFEFIASL